MFSQRRGAHDRDVQTAVLTLREVQQQNVIRAVSTRGGHVLIRDTRAPGKYRAIPTEDTQIRTFWPHNIA